MMTAAPLVIGIDASTTACKAIAWNMRGEPQAEGRAEIALSNPATDAYEQDAEEWWSAVTRAVKDVAHQLGPRSKAIRGLSVANQRETFVVTDANSRPLHPALVWMDSRCRAEVERAKAAFGAERLHEVSGKPACTTPSLYKIQFLLGRAAPQLAREQPMVLDVHAFLVWRLTGELKTSVACADPTGLVDMALRAWSSELLELAGLEQSQLPDLVEPGAHIGDLSQSAARACGLSAGLPVFAGAGDGQAAGLGAGITDGSCAYLNLGTALVSGVLSRSYATNRAFRTLYGALPGTYFLETDLKGGTFTISWLVEKWLGSDTSGAARALDDLEREAVKIPPGSDGLLLVPYWNGVMNPYWDDDATGIVVGWHGAHGPAHLYRAILEGLALEQRLHTTGVEAAIGREIAELRVMGGGAKSDLFCQIVADALGKPVTRSGTTEATALGAGVLAAAGAGLHPSLQEATRSMTSTGKRFAPGDQSEIYDRLFAVHRELYPALAAHLKRLTELRT